MGRDGWSRGPSKLVCVYVSHAATTDVLAERCLACKLWVPRTISSHTHLFFPCDASSISSLAVPRLHFQHSSEEFFRCLGQEANLSVWMQAVQVGRLRGQLSINILKPKAGLVRE